MKSTQRTTKRYIIFGILSGMVVLIGLLYLGGFRFSGGTLASPGEVIFEVESTDKNIAVFLDGVERQIAVNDGSIVIERLSPGEHTFILSKDGYWPWQKIFDVKSGERIVAAPFFITQNVSGVAITQADPEYFKLRELSSTRSIPSTARKLSSNDESVSVWFEGTTLMAQFNADETQAPQYFCTEEKCKEPITVLSFGGPVRNIVFYKDRNDLVVVAVDDLIAALELDSRGTRNFQPIYKGKSPTFSLSAGGTLIVTDDAALMEIPLP